MTENKRVLKIAIAGVLIAIGIIIPMISPFKIIIEPASFTLASHVVIFMAMFISPAMAVAVACGTAAGFFLGGFPLVVVFRALSHVIFAGLGAWYLHNTKQNMTFAQLRIFSLIIALIHAVCEVVVSSAFYFGQMMGSITGFMTSVILLVGVGTFIHSLIDFEITLLIKAPLVRQRSLRDIIK
jgi:niacin transporter